MFDPILDLRRRRMQQTGLPEITGNVQPPQIGPDLMPAQNVQPPLPVIQPAPLAEGGPDLSALSQLGAQRGMGELMKRMRPKADPDSLSSLPVLKNLFRRQS